MIIIGISPVAAKSLIKQFGVTHYHKDANNMILVYASPCQSCGELSTGGNEITIQSPDAPSRKYIESHLQELCLLNEAGYDDAGREVCAECTP